MADRRKDIPAVNSPNFQQQVREALSTYLGNRGDKLDRGVTVRDLVDAGLVELNAGYLGGTGKVPIKGPGPDVGSGGGAVVEPDLTPPPTPTGAQVTPTFNTLVIEHDQPSYTQGHGHARTRVYGAQWVSGPLPTFASAELITEFTGTVFAHPTTLGTTWHIWLKWVSEDGVESTTPAGGTNGIARTTGKVGNSDLGPLIVEAANLANGALPAKLGATKFDTVLVRGTGLNGADGGPGSFVLSGVTVGGTVTRGVTVRVFNRATHVEAAAVRGYDTYGDPIGGGQAMADYLNTLSADYVVMVASFDACSFRSAPLRAALKRCGATLAIEGAQFEDRFQYALIGIPGSGQGNGMEMLKPSTVGLAPADATCFWVDGLLMGSGSTINGMTLLTGDYFVDGAVQARHMAANSIAVGSAAIQNGAIRNALIENLAVDNAKIADGAISTAKIGDAQITNAKIQDAAITHVKILDGEITNAKIQNGAITNAKIGSAQVNLANINTASIGSLSAITATIGTLRTAASGARVEIRDNIIQVFYWNDQEAVRISSS